MAAGGGWWRVVAAYFEVFECGGGWWRVVASDGGWWSHLLGAKFFIGDYFLD